METVSKERKILKKLIKISVKHQGCIPFKLVPQYPESNCYIKRLISKRLIGTTSYYNEKNQYTGALEIDSYYITDEGKLFFEVQHERLRSFIFRSILVPVLVSFATTLIIQCLLPLIKSAISKMLL